MRFRDPFPPGYEHATVHSFFQALIPAIGAAASLAGSVMGATSDAPEVQPGPMELMQVERYKSLYLPVEEALLGELGFVKQPKYKQVARRVPAEGSLARAAGLGGKGGGGALESAARGAFETTYDMVPDGEEWVYQPEGYLPETTRQVAEVKGQYGGLAAAARRSGAVAFPAGGGLPSTMNKQIGLGQARDVAKVRAEDAPKRYGRLYQVAQLGQGIPTDLMKSELTRTGLEANLAAAHGGGLSRAVSGFGNTLGGLAQRYMLNNATTSNPGGTSSGWRGSNPGSSYGGDYWDWSLGWDDSVGA